MTAIKPIADQQPVFEGQTVHGKTFSKPNKTLWTLTPIPTAQKWWENAALECRAERRIHWRVTVEDSIPEGLKQRIHESHWNRIPGYRK